MAPVFIFAKDIEDSLKAGKKEIEVPKGARISAAAMDLIRDNKIQISYISPETRLGEPSTSWGETSGAERQTEEPRPKVELVKDSGEAVLQTQPDGELTEEELNAIVNRVIRRFREARGEISAEQKDQETTVEDDDDLVICRCEEITKGEIKDVIRNGMKTLNGIKRVTRAGMGLCQGQTCQRLVTQILASELGVSPAEVEPTTARAPVRPIRLSTFATG